MRMYVSRARPRYSFETSDGIRNLPIMTGLRDERSRMHRSWTGVFLLARPKQISASPAPGAGTMFALRAIGLVLAARWAFSMSQMGYLSSLRAMTSSPWACVNLVLIFLL